MSKIELFIQDAQLAYAKAISNLFNCWVHDEDGGCDYDAIGYKQVVIVNSALLIYQPMGKPGEGWIDNGSILIMPTKESGIKLNDALVNKLKPFFEEVDNKLVDSYNGHVKKFGYWIENLKTGGSKTDKPDFKKITGIFDTIKFDKGILKFKWLIKVLWNGPCSYWYPIELINWFKQLPAYERFKYERYRINKKKLEERIEESMQKIRRMEADVKTLGETPDLEDLEIKVEELHHSIEREKMYAHSVDVSLQDLINTRDEPEPSLRAYTEDDEYVVEWYKENENGDKKVRCYGECSKDMIASEITYSHAFPERIPEPISGKKRKANNDNVSPNKKR
jgi:hypothetical protein